MMAEQIESNMLVKKADDNNFYKNHFISNNNNSTHTTSRLYNNTLPYTLNKLNDLNKLNGVNYRTDMIKYGAIPDEMEAKVLVIYTGGTVGMIRNENNVLEPIKDAFLKKIRSYPHLHDEEYATKRFGPESNVNTLILPYVQDERRRIAYTIIEYDPLLDSSNMSFNEWAHIAEDIEQSYQLYDGFVILHGTDTLSYTASALSFMFENLGKSIVLTGSQIPIFEARTDGKNNFTTALIIAGNYVIPEVCIFFDTKLFRGNRTIKISSNALGAFNSPNMPPIATCGINLDVDYRSIFRPSDILKFTVHSKLNANVGVLRIFPSISTDTVRPFLQAPMQGVVLQTFGAGNMPNNRPDLLHVLKEASKRGVIIVNCTQCTSGSVDAIYATGSALLDCGVLSGYDMTPEAALTKLAYVLSKDDWSMETKKDMMQRSLRGEMTNGKVALVEDFNPIDAVAQSLQLSSPSELAKLRETLFPAMLNSAVIDKDTQKIARIKNYGGDLSIVNSDYRSALHLACCEGNKDIVNYLLLNGASVHLRDRYDNTPLSDAITNDKHEIIQILVKCGAHLSSSVRYIGEMLCSAAARGSIKRLESYRLANVNLSQQDISGRTALHLACLHGYLQVVKYLLSHNVDEHTSDLLGLCPIDYAKLSDQQTILQILTTNNV